jgi:hypothetical protein
MLGILFVFMIANDSLQSNATTSGFILTQNEWTINGQNIE